MPDFFPRNSIAWRIEEPHALRRLTVSLPQMALMTGIGMRLWRSFVLTHGSPDSWAWVGGTFLVGVAFLFGMCAVHLANFTIRKWIWRAPFFAVLEAGSEIVTTLALTAFNLEPLGADKADLSDWLPTSIRILSWRIVGIVLFTAVLSVVVSVLRRIILSAEHRGHTVSAIERTSAGQRDRAGGSPAAAADHHDEGDRPAGGAA